MYFKTKKLKTNVAILLALGISTMCGLVMFGDLVEYSDINDANRFVMTLLGKYNAYTTNTHLPIGVYIANLIWF